MKSLIVALGVAFTLSAQAGSIKITATGWASKPAEYVVVSATVVSRCYPTSLEAANKNAELVNEIKAIMAPYESSDLKDALSTDGGQFSRRREAEYLNNKEVEYCAQGWRTEKTITLKLKDIAKLPEVQDAILNVVDKKAAVKPEGPNTYATWSDPRPEVCDETRKQMRIDALKDAIKNARVELAALAGECQLGQVQLKAVTSGNEYAPRPQAYSARSMAESADVAPSGSTFEFSAITESVTRDFEFAFTDGAESCEIPAEAPAGPVAP